MRGQRKWLSLALSIVMLIGVMAVPAQAANTVELGGIGGIWKFSQESTGTEVIKIQKLSLGVSAVFPDGSTSQEENSYYEREETAYLLPAGTNITAVNPGSYAGESHDIICVDTYSLDGVLISSENKSVSAPIVVAADKIYSICGSYSDGRPAYAEPLYVKGVASADSGQVDITITKPVSGFTDVVADAYYADAVKWAVDKGITVGTSATTFSPDINCTNGQILTFLWRANGQPEPTISNPFTDVKASDYYYKAALWASEKGLIAGTTLGADVPSTRSMVVTYLWKLAGSPEQAPISGLTDVESGAEYAIAVAWAVEQKITAGTSATTFAPDGICTRGQIVTFLFRAMGK